jgi:hypothetical protein
LDAASNDSDVAALDLASDAASAALDLASAAPDSALPPRNGAAPSPSPLPYALPLADFYLGDGDALDLSGAWTPRRRL